MKLSKELTLSYVCHKSSLLVGLSPSQNVYCKNVKANDRRCAPFLLLVRPTAHYILLSNSKSESKFCVNHLVSCRQVQWCTFVCNILYTMITVPHDFISLYFSMFHKQRKQYKYIVILKKLSTRFLLTVNLRIVLFYAFIFLSHSELLYMSAIYHI